MGQQPSTLLTNEIKQRIQRRWGDRAVSACEQAAQIFQQLDVVADGALTREEFSKSFGMMGIANSMLSNFLFDAIDTNQNNEISLEEFINFMMVQFFGTISDKLDFGFRVIDLDKNGVITKAEVVTMIRTFFQVLSTFQLQSPEVDKYVDALWDLWDLNKDEEVTQEEYKKGCLNNSDFIKYLGLTHKGSDPVKRIGNKVFLGQQKWDFMLSVMLGIQVATERLSPPLARQLTQEDCEKFQIHDIPAIASTITIESFAPQVFREIRRTFGVSEESYTSSLGVKQILGSLLLGDLSGLSELVSEGKSGSFFYFSSDNKFLVKTITNSERQTLVKMLCNYVNYVQKTPNTLLTRIYGLYKLSIDNTIRRFVVMANVFDANVPIHERYDLKGSTHGRTVGDENLNDTSMVFKDLDFIKKGRKFTVRSDLRDALMEQIQQDAMFLQDNMIIDYSLLLGVHKVPLDKRPQPPEHIKQKLPKEKTYVDPWVMLPANVERKMSTGHFTLSRIFSRRKTIDKAKSTLVTRSETALTPSIFQQDHNGMYSERTLPDGTTVYGEEILFVGIIDTLIAYEAFKQGEHLVKSIIYDGSQISVVPPDEYAPRFIKFMMNGFVV